MLALGLKMNPPSATLGNHNSVQCYGLVDLDTIGSFASSGRAPHAWGVLHYLLRIGAVVVGVLAGFNAAGPLWFQFILFRFFLSLPFGCFAKSFCK